MQTALHIGGGKVTLSNSDSPVILTPEEIPFIPGSSFKGALRSTVEKLVPGLPGLRTCGLIELSEEALKEERARNKAIPICSTVRQGEISEKMRHAQTVQQRETIRKETLRDLCHTCQLFGSPYAASRINVSDLYMPASEWNGIIQRRDGVAIDRDSEKAKDRLKYDFEVVPASAVFQLSITLENATPQDLQLVCVGLSEFVHGFGVIGGKRSRGLGICRLNELKVSELKLQKLTDEEEDISEDEKNRRLRDFLLHRKFPVEKVPGEQFLAQHIETIFGEVA